MLYLFTALSFILSSSLVAHEVVVKPEQHRECPESIRKGAEKLLFIFHAKDGHLQSVRGGTYELTLYHVNKSLTYFTDRPDRRAGKMSVTQFLDRWAMGEDSYKKDNPNAGLVSISESSLNGQFSDIPVTLSDPRYDQKHDRLTFRIKPLEKKQKILTGNLGETTLFIDMAQQFTGLPMDAL